MHVFSWARTKLQDPVLITDLKGMSFLTKISARKGISCYEPKFYHLGLQVSMWPSCWRALRREVPLPFQDFWAAGLIVSPECAAWWEASSTAPSLLCLLYREICLVISPTPSPEWCLTHCIPWSTGTLLMSLHHRGLPKPTEETHWGQGVESGHPIFQTSSWQAFSLMEKNSLFKWSWVLMELMMH